MMRCALVDLSNNLVVNLIIADPTTDPAPSGHVIIGISDDSPVSIGWSYSNGEFTAPPEQ